MTDQECMKLYFQTLLACVEHTAKTENSVIMATVALRCEWPSLPLKLAWILVLGMRERLATESAEFQRRYQEAIDARIKSDK